MTRAFVAFAHGDFSTAVAVQPFVLLAYPVLLALGLTMLLPTAWVAQLEVAAAAHGALVTRAYRVGVISFLGFGLGRFAVFLALGKAFP